MAATELTRLNLADALDLLVLLARDAHPRFEAAALRWVARFAAERARSVNEVVIAAAAVLELRSSDGGRAVLLELVQHRD